jgi:hypothetical protein
MKTVILEKYAMGMCLITVACFAVALGVGLYDAVQITVPEFTVSVSSSVQSEKAEAVRSLIMVLVVIFADITVYVPHWVIGKRARESRAA